MIDQLVFGGFLVANLVIGLYYGRKVKNLREYALGTHSFSTLMIAATITATWTTGTGFNVYLDNFFHTGLLWFLYGLTTILALWVVGKMALRMGEFVGSLSIAEVIGKAYGPYARIAGGLSCIALCTVYLGGQFRAGVDVLSTLFGDKSANWLVYAIAIVITVYSILGGINSVIATDFFQFILMALFMPLLLFIVYRAIPADVSIYDRLTQTSQLSLNTFFTSIRENMLPFCLVIGLRFIIGFQPQMFQRTLLSNKVRQTRKAFFLSGLFWTYIIGAIMLLSLLLMAANPSLAATGEKKLLHFVITQYAHPGLKGLIAIGLCCIMMSTADSYLNTSSTIFVNDVLKPLGITANPLRSAHLFSIASSALAVLLLKLKLSDQSFTQLSTLAWACYFPIVVVPALLVLLGFRTTQRIALAGMATGACIVLCYFIFLYNPLTHKSDHTRGLIGLAVCANAAVMLGGHYLLGEPQGWVGVKVKAPLIAEKQAQARKWRNFKTKLSRFSVFHYLNKQLPKSKATYSFFALYILGPVFLSFFLLKRNITINNSLFYWMAYPMLGINALLLTYPSWLSTFLPDSFITYFFPLSISFSLFGVPSALWMMSAFHPIYSVLLVINVLIVSLQFSWVLTGLAALSAMFITGLLLQWTSHSTFVLTVTASYAMMMAYAGILLLCLALALLRRQAAQKRIASYYYDLVREHQATTKTLRKLRTTPERFVQQLRDKVTGLEAAFTASKALEEALRKPKEKQDTKALTTASRQLTDHIKDSSRYLNKLFTLVEQGGLLRNKNIALHTFTHKLLNAIARNSALHTSLITANQSTAQQVNWDSNKIKNVVLKGHKRLQKAHPDQDYFFLHIQDTHLAYPNYPKGLPAVALTLTTQETAPKLEPTYLPPDKVLSIATTPYEREAQQCVSTHYGFFGAQQAPNAYLFVLPQNLKDIRPGSISDSPAHAFSPAMLRKAKSMEAAFWTVISKEDYDIPVIEKAVSFMKDAHGHQQRKSGEPYYTHPLTVAQYVSQHNSKQDVLIAALLHDTIEDTDVTPEALKLHFSPRVSTLVHHLSHIETTFKKYKLSDSQTHNKLQKANHDKEAVLIKLCDRLHNLYTLGAMPKHKQLAKAQETLKVYIPLGKQVGYTQLAQELTRLCEEVLKQAKK